MPRDRVEALIVELRQADRSRAVGRSVAAAIRASVAAGREDEDPVERFFDRESEAALVRIARAPGMVDERFVRHLFRQPAVHELFTDTLSRSLSEFSTIVPKTIISLLPGFSSRLSRLGGVASRLVEEIEARLEPEIRRFVQTSTRRALDRAADFAVDHMEDQVARDSRESFLRFVLSSKGEELCRPMSDGVLDDVDRLAVALAEFWATSEVVDDELRRALDRLYEQLGDRPMRDVLEQPAGHVAWPTEAWAAATWPLVKAVLETPAVEAWLEELSRELLALDPRDTEGSGER